jgi:hypothetical protein
MGEQLKVRPSPSVLPEYGTPALPPRPGAVPPPASDKSATDGGRPPVPARTQ